MAWRWIKRFRLFAGVNATASANGVGWSWGLPGFRIGISPHGRKWISIGIPGTGLRYFKYLKPPNIHTPEEEPEQHRVSRVRSGKINSWKNLK